MRWARGLRLLVLPTASPAGSALRQASPRGPGGFSEPLDSKSKEREGEGQAVLTEGGAPSSDGALAL